jgi:hypothetical protein
MATKTGTWLIGIGCFIVLAGLSILPAAFGPHGDKTLLGLSMVALSTGMMLIAGGLYVKARALGGSTSASSSSGGKRARKAACDRCGKYEPVIQCRVHQQHLCANCLGTHYDFRSCAYVPSTRRGATKATAYSQAAGA